MHLKPTGSSSVQETLEISLSAQLGPEEYGAGQIAQSVVIRQPVRQAIALGSWIVSLVQVACLVSRFMFSFDTNLCTVGFCASYFG